MIDYKRIIAGWTPVQRKQYYTVEFDLENSPLQIKTNTEVGTSGSLKVNFFTLSYSYAGSGFGLKLKPLQYSFIGCLDSYVEFSEDLLPSETEKVWTIFLSRVSGVRRIVIHCNEMEIINFVVSESTCAMADWESKWVTRDVKRIQLIGYSYSSSSTATEADYFRAGEYQILKYFNGTTLQHSCTLGVAHDNTRT